jgi:MFS family permease
MRFFSALYGIVIAIWLGSLVGIGYIAAPVLFSQLADRTLAGNLAGAMFSAEAWLGMVCGAYLLLYLAITHGARSLRCSVFWIALLMLAVTLLSHFGIQPLMAELKLEALPKPVMESALRGRFALWHGVSLGLDLLQPLLGIALVVLQGRGKRR